MTTLQVRQGMGVCERAHRSPRVTHVNFYSYVWTGTASTPSHRRFPHKARTLCKRHGLQVHRSWYGA